MSSNDHALHAGVLEGRVLDATTSAPVPGAWISGGIVDAEGTSTYADENGHFRIDLSAGTAKVFASYGDVTSGVKTAVVTEGRATRIELRLDHAELLRARRDDPPDHCPGSRPGAVVLGHTTPQADLDALANVVLARIAAGNTALADQGMTKGPTRYVAGELRGGQRLSEASLPPGFVARTKAELQAESDRTGAEINYLDFDSIYSDGTCALVRGGGDFVIPSSKRFVTKLCCCTGTEIYEKQNGRWVFVRRVHETCA